MSMSHPKASRGWEPGKCIPQSDKKPRYTIKSTRVREQTQFMRWIKGSLAFGKGPHMMDQSLVEPKGGL
jgi:hypothetical protein